MKIKIMLFALCALLCAGSTYAQPPGMMDPEQRIQQMISDLEITKEQEAKFREVMAKVNEKRSAMMQEMMASGGPGGDRSAMMTKMQELRAESEELLATVLTEAQMAKYKEQQASRRRPPG